MSRLPDTLSENTVAYRRVRNVMRRVTPRMKVAPFTDGWVVMSMRLDGRSFVASQLRLTKFAGTFAMAFLRRVVPLTPLRVPTIIACTGIQLFARSAESNLNILRLAPLSMSLSDLPLVQYLPLTLLAIRTSPCPTVPLPMTPVQHPTPVEAGISAIRASIKLRSRTLRGILPLPKWPRSAMRLIGRFLAKSLITALNTTLHRRRQKLLPRSTLSVAITVLPSTTTELIMDRLVLRSPGTTCPTNVLLKGTFFTS